MTLMPGNSVGQERPLLTLTLHLLRIPGGHALVTHPLFRYFSPDNVYHYSLGILLSTKARSYIFIIDILLAHVLLLMDIHYFCMR